MKLKQFIFVFLVELLHTSAAVSAPPISSKCLLWDSGCLTLKSQAITSILVAGIPELDIQPLNNIIIDYIHIDIGGYKIDLRSVNVQGMSEAIVDDISMDYSSKNGTIAFHTDFEVKSRYINNGTLLSSPVYGEGDFTIKYENVQIIMNVIFEIIKDAQDKEVMNLKSFKHTFDVRNGAEHTFENLFIGDKKLSDSMHSKMQKNWKYLTILYAPYVFDPLTEKIFYAIRNYVRSEPLGTVALHTL